MNKSVYEIFLPDQPKRILGRFQRRSGLNLFVLWEFYEKTLILARIFVNSKGNMKVHFV